MQKEAHQEFCNPWCCSRFPRYFLIRLIGHEMFLHLVHVDPVDQFASSFLIQPAVLSESSVPFWYSSSFVFMHTTLSMQTAGNVSVMCRGGRLHATLFGKTAILSLQRVPHRTNILCSDEVSKYFLYGTILGFVKSREVSPTQFSSSIGFTIVTNTDCLPLLRLCPPGINPLLIVECTSLTFPIMTS